jgi:hypothetical protein
MPSWTDYADFGSGLFIVLHLIAFIRPHWWVSRRLHPSFPADPDIDHEFSVESLYYNGVCDINHILRAPDGTPLRGLHDVIDGISQYAEDTRTRPGEGNWHFAGQLQYTDPHVGHVCCKLLLWSHC